MLRFNFKCFLHKPALWTIRLPRCQNAKNSFKDNGIYFHFRKFNARNVIFVETINHFEIAVVLVAFRILFKSWYVWQFNTCALKIVSHVMAFAINEYSLFKHCIYNWIKLSLNLGAFSFWCTDSHEICVNVTNL